MLIAAEDITAPVALQKPHSAEHHGVRHQDPYFWLKDPGYPEVADEEILAYLRAENSYFANVMAPHAALTEALFAEIKGRVKQDDEGVVWQKGAFEYRWAFASGAQYRTWYWRARSADPFASSGGANADWQVLLDETIEAGDKDFFKLGTLSVSPNGRLFAYSLDDNGSERFTIYVRDLQNGETVGKPITETSGEIIWATASDAFSYVKVSKEWRPFRVLLHRLGAATDTVIFEEKNTSFFVHMHATSSDKYLIIRSADHVTAECYSVPLADLAAAPLCLAPRRDGHDYYVDHGGQDFYIRSNTAHRNFCVYAVPEAAPGQQSWRAVVEGSDTRYLHGMQAFDGFIAVEDRLDGLDQIYILKAGGKGSYITLPEAVYEVSLGHNAEADQNFVRLAYSSLVTPPTVYDYQLADARLIQRKQQEIPSGYDKSQYMSERLMVEARDGVAVPVSIVYKKGWQKGTKDQQAGQDQQAGPLHLYGYGAYGLGTSPAFSSARLSLLDRGFAYAIAHVRGGDEMGYGWYEDGKLDKRENTFNDFVDVGRALVARGYAAPGGISISGGSAGGELMGAVVNQAPELFKGAVLHVPFVDVLNTMLDADLPLTPIEWPEWGNPIADKAAYDTIAGYCPYSNIEPKAYPPMLVTGGLNDPRVTYWEPAKWTAKLRATKTDNSLLMMKINMGAGHGGKSGRFERLHEVAEEYTFLLMCFGIENK